jgi:hypothetical protein
VCIVPWTLLAVCAGPDLATVCAGLEREEEPCCCVHRLELIVSPSLKIIKDNSSRGCSFPPGSEPCIYGVLCVWLSVMLLLSE